MSTRHTPVLDALDFVVVNTRTGNPCAAFLLPRDALHYIEWRRTSEGPHGPTYEIQNANGSFISPQLAEHVEARNEIGAQEWARRQPGLPDASPDFFAGRKYEREAAIAYFEKVARETADQSAFGKAFWSRQAALALRMELHA